jgi:hypothetical protein
MYFCLGQILPPSFAYYMLRLRIALSVNASPAKADTGVTKSRPTTQLASIWPAVAVLSVTAYAVITLKPTTATESDWQVLTRVLWLRILLFVPLFVDTTSLFNVKHMQSLLVEQLAPLSLILIASSFGRYGFSETWPSILAGFSNPAVRTLSSDLLVKCVGDLLLKIVL